MYQKCTKWWARGDVCQNDRRGNTGPPAGRHGKALFYNELHIPSLGRVGGTGIATARLSYYAARKTKKHKFERNEHFAKWRYNFMRPIKHFEKGLTYAASGVFNAVKSVNQFKPNASFIPKWSDKPLLKSWQKSKPTLGFPRQTDSLCPNCVIEAREDILAGKERCVDADQ